jgi:hypothetical protein
VGRQGQLYPENSNGSSASDHVNEVTMFSKPIDEGTKFIFEKCRLLEENSKYKVMMIITRLDDNTNNPIEKLVLTLDIAEYTQSSMQDKAMKIGTFEDNNKLFIVVSKYATDAYSGDDVEMRLFYGTDFNCVSAGNPNTCAETVYSTCLCTIRNSSKSLNIIKHNKNYWMIEKDVVKGQRRTTHPYYVRVKDTPF